MGEKFYEEKLLGMLLAGTLMVGAVGSYAWFSDKAEVDSGIKLTMGTLDVDVKEISDGWNIVDETSEIINKNQLNILKMLDQEIVSKENL